MIDIPETITTIDDLTLFLHQQDEQRMLAMLAIWEHPEKYTPEQRLDAEDYIKAIREETRYFNKERALEQGAELDWNGYCGRGVERY